MPVYDYVLRDARATFSSSYPFEAASGGLGVSLSVSNSSSSTQLVGDGGPQIMVTNLGTVSAHLRFGNANVVATSACMAILPGIPYTFSIPLDSTHVAGISLGATTVQLTRGYGN